MNNPIFVFSLDSIIELVDFDPRPLSVYAIVNGRKREENT